MRCEAMSDRMVRKRMESGGTTHLPPPHAPRPTQVVVSNKKINSLWRRPGESGHATARRVRVPPRKRRQSHRQRTRGT